MSKEGGNFFEKHVEKMVLGVVGLVCLWLLVTHVLMSPNVVVVDRKPLNPGRIDPYVSKQAAYLADELRKRPKEKWPQKRMKKQDSEDGEDNQK